MRLDAQPTAILWQHTIGCGSEYLNDCLIDKEGNYVMAGQGFTACSYTDSVAYGYGDGWVVKVDSSGKKLWSHLFGGTKADKLLKIRATMDGGYIAVGWSNSDLDVKNKGDNDWWIVKLDKNGVLEWQRDYGSSKFDQAWAVAPTGDSGYLVTGIVMAGDSDVSTFIGLADLWLIKLDSKGRIMWQKTYGSTKSDYASDIEKTTDGNYIITGMAGAADHDISYLHGSSDVWVLKINGDGHMLWSKTYGGGAYQQGDCIVQTKDGGYMVGAMTTSDDGEVTKNYGKEDMWAIKIDDTGRLQWQKSYGGSDMEPRFASITESMEGGYFFTGPSASNDFDAIGNHNMAPYADMLVIKADDTGAVEWSHMYGGTSGDASVDAYQLKDSSYVVGGTTNSTDGDVKHASPTSNAWIIDIGKVKSTGTNNVQRTKGISVYPTITNDIVNVQLNNSKVRVLGVMDIRGMPVRAGVERNAKGYAVHLQGQPSGMYFLKIETEAGIYVYKVVMQ